MSTPRKPRKVHNISLLLDYLFLQYIFLRLYVIFGRLYTLSIFHGECHENTSHILDPKSGVDLLSIMELRLDLGPINAALAAKRATPEKSRFYACRTRSASASTSCPNQVFAGNDIGFHMLLAQATHNLITLDIMNMATHFFLEQQSLISHQASRRRNPMKNYAQILAAVIAREP